MSSLFHKPDGTWVFQFTHEDKRKTRRLYGVSEREAQGFAAQVDRLIHQRRYNLQPDRTTLAWLADLGQTERKWLAKHGLIDRVVHSTLGELVDGFLATLAVSKNTREEIDSTVRSDTPHSSATSWRFNNSLGVSVFMRHLSFGDDARQLGSDTGYGCFIEDSRIAGSPDGRYAARPYDVLYAMQWYTQPVSYDADGGPRGGA